MMANRLCALLMLATLMGMPSYGHTAQAGPSAAGIVLVQDRLEMRSFQPYAGLQDENVPVDVPIQRGVKKVRPEIVKPTAVNPVIDTGVPSPFTAQWYRLPAPRPIAASSRERGSTRHSPGSGGSATEPPAFQAAGRLSA